MNRKEVLLNAFAKFAPRIPRVIGPDWTKFGEKFFELWIKIQESVNDLKSREEDLWNFMEGYPTAKKELKKLTDGEIFDLTHAAVVEVRERKKKRPAITSPEITLDPTPLYPHSVILPLQLDLTTENLVKGGSGVVKWDELNTGKNKNKFDIHLDNVYEDGVAIPTLRLKEKYPQNSDVLLAVDDLGQVFEATVIGYEEPAFPARDLAAAQKNGYKEVPVFFATDRAPSPEEEPSRFFENHRGEDRLAYGIAKVSIPNIRKEGYLDKPFLLKYWKPNDPQKHILLLDTVVLEKGQFLEGVQEAFTHANSKDVLIFIHGFHVSFKDGLRRAAQLAHDTKFPGLAMAYSWPSGDETLKYVADGDLMTWVRPHFQEFRQLVRTQTGAETVHIIAHSMGNRFLVETLDNLRSLPPAAGEAPFGQVVFAAPDVGKARFLQFLKDLRADFAKRFTLYASSHDKALKGSKKVNNESRAGDSGGELVIRHPPLDTIDASHVETEFWGHSYVGESRTIVCDITELLLNNTAPGKRSNIRGVPETKPDHWAFKVEKNFESE